MSAVGLIYHIATCTDWERALSDGEYATSTLGRTLTEEGFIHASLAAQVPGVADRYYRGVQEDLLLLAIDPGRVRAEVRWEDVPGSPLPYPHIYGPLNVDAVLSATPFGPGRDGAFGPAPAG